MVQLLRRAGLPEPVRQHEVVVASRRFRIDLAYPELKIAIEIDGDEPHFGARKTDADNTRDGLLQLGGWLTQHFTRATSATSSAPSAARGLASDRVAFSWRMESSEGLPSAKKTG